MKPLRTMAAAAALAAALSGGALAAPANADPGDWYGGGCIGGAYSYHVWNLFYPMEAYALPSCAINELVANRNLVGNYANYVGLVASKVPVAIPLVIYAMAWNTSTTWLAQCNARGRGAVFTQSNMNGMIISCHSQ